MMLIDGFEKSALPRDGRLGGDQGDRRAANGGIGSLESGARPALFSREYRRRGTENQKNESSDTCKTVVAMDDGTMVVVIANAAALFGR